MPYSNIKKGDIITLKSIERIKSESEWRYKKNAINNGIRINTRYFINIKMMHMFGKEHKIYDIMSTFTSYDFVLYCNQKRNHWNFIYDWIENDPIPIMDIDNLFEEIDI